MPTLATTVPPARPAAAALLALLCALALAPAPATAGPAAKAASASPAPDADADAEHWALHSVQPAPGQSGQSGQSGQPAGPPAPWPLGTRWRLSAQGLHGPAPLACAPARQQLLALPPAGLFQGALPAADPGASPAAGADAAARTAAALDLPAERIATLRLDCANASFDLHLDRQGRWLLMLDGRLLRWQRLGAPAGPQAVVRALLLQHLSGPPAPATERLATLAPWFTPALQRRVAAWRRRVVPADTVPSIDGDPFTDSQEPPRSITLGPLQRHGARARQTLLLAFDGGGQRALHYRLLQQQGRWRLDDFDDGRGGRGSRLSALLAAP